MKNRWAEKSESIKRYFHTEKKENKEEKYQTTGFTLAMKNKWRQRGKVWNDTHWQWKKKPEVGAKKNRCGKKKWTPKDDRSDGEWYLDIGSEKQVRYRWNWRQSKLIQIQINVV